MADKIWNVGIQQYERICDECNEKYTEDEVRWFYKRKKLICEYCFLEKDEVTK